MLADNAGRMRIGLDLYRWAPWPSLVLAVDYRWSVRPFIQECQEANPREPAGSFSSQAWWTRWAPEASSLKGAVGAIQTHRVGDLARQANWTPTWGTAQADRSGIGGPHADARSA